MNALDWQRLIYLNGFGGKTPLVSPDMAKLEKQAFSRMSKQAAAYIAGGAGLHQTLENNRQDFNRYRILPKMLRNVSESDTSVELFGLKLNSPFFLAPVGVLEMVHSEADLAVGKAAAETGIPFIFSNQASVPMEKVAEVMGNSPRFFQLYWSKSRELVASLVNRAEKCGCQAIVLTLDTTMLGWRTKDLDLGYLPFLYGKGIAQYTSDPVFQQLLDENIKKSNSNPRPLLTLATIVGLIESVKNYPGKGFISKLRSGRPLAAVRLFTQIYTNPGLTWENLNFLRQLTKLPILLKGILRPDDARKAIDYGMNGIVVSNHGGRQVDGAISTIEALPGVVNAVAGQVPVLMDSGIRSGADAFKALALGATAVGLGRPYVYALTLGGQAGVWELIRHFQAEFELTMRLSGCRNVSEISKEMVEVV